MRSVAVLVLVIGAACLAALGMKVGRSLVTTPSAPEARERPEAVPRLDSPLQGVSLGSLWLAGSKGTDDTLVGHLQGQPGVLIWVSTHCSACLEELREWRDLRPDLTVLVAGFEPLEDLVALARRERLVFPVLHEGNGILLHHHEATKFPTVMGLDGNGRVRTVRSGRGTPPAGIVAELRTSMVEEAGTMTWVTSGAARFGTEAESTRP